MMGVKQKLIAGATMLVMNVAVWAFTLLSGGLFTIAIAVLFTTFSLGAAWRVLAA